MFKKIMSVVCAAAVMITTVFSMAIPASAVTGKVKLFGCTISSDAKQICFVRGEEGDLTAEILAEYYAPKIKKYFFVDGDVTIDCAKIAKELPELQNLVIIGCDVSNLSSLSKMKSLKWLSLHNNEGAESLAFLKNMTGLTKFKYTNLNCKGIKSVSYLKKLTELELDVNASAAEDLSPVKGLKKLKKLTVDGGFKNLEPLKNLTALEYVDVASGSLQDISGLYGLKKLKTVNLGDCHSVTGKEIVKLTQITSLGLDCMDISDLEELAVMSWLKELSLSYLYRTSRSDVYEAIEGMKGLESLSITQMRLKNCDFVYDLRELKELSLMLNEISDISGLRKLTKLETLNLYNNNVTNPASLNGLTNLRSVNLNDNSVISLKPFEKLTKLEYLGVSRGSFKDASTLYKLKNLKELDVYETALGEDFADKFTKSIPGCKVNYKYDFDY